MSADEWEERMAARAADRQAVTEPPKIKWPYWGPGLRAPDDVEDWLREHAMSRVEAEDAEKRAGLIGCACAGSPLKSAGAPCYCALWRMCRERAFRGS